MKYRKLFFSGIIIFIGSIILGILGTLWGIYSSFDALTVNETAGLNQVGAGIENALVFNVISIIGSIIGLVLIVIGVVKAKKDKKII